MRPCLLLLPPRSATKPRHGRRSWRTVHQLPFLQRPRRHGRDRAAGRAERHARVAIEGRASAAPARRHGQRRPVRQAGQAAAAGRRNLQPHLRPASSTGRCRAAAARGTPATPRPIRAALVPWLAGGWGGQGGRRRADCTATAAAARSGLPALPPAARQRGAGLARRPRRPLTMCTAGWRRWRPAPSGPPPQDLS
jgi:hypothetical protein